LVNAAKVRLFSGSRTVATASADETAHVGTSARGADVPTPISRFAIFVMWFWFQQLGTRFFFRIFLPNMYYTNGNPKQTL
jgi:hypothetical protein